MVKQQCLFGTLLSIKVPGRHFLVPESWRKGVKMTEPNRQSGEKEERIIEIEIERLRPFKEHPFQVKDDKEMFLLQESIEKYGILNPLIVRPVPDGYYEIISGHRRKHAAEKLGYRKVPVIIRVLSEDDSILSMVDSNLHRERISYSEKAFAYKLKNDVLKRKSGRKKSQVDHKTPRKRSIDIISEDCGDSPKQVQRYISLTKLIPEMLQKLDDEIISFCPAVEIAALKENEQRELLKAMDYAQAIPSLSQAQRIKQLSKEKQLSLEKMEEIMCEVKKGEITRVAFTNEQLHKYFPNSYTPAMMKREILALLKLWKKRIMGKLKEEEIMCKVISVVNQKGGVGKTTTTVNVGIGLAREGKKVLLIDADPQGSLTASLGYEEPDDLRITLATIMMDVINEEEISLEDGILHHQENVDLLPANIELSALEVTMGNVMSREMIMKEYIDAIRCRYDYILIDCMPSLGMMTINALVSSDSVLIPVQAAYLPVKGLQQLIKTILTVKKRLNRKLAIEGILLTMVDFRTNYARDIASRVHTTYGSQIEVFENVIPMSVKAAETSAEGKSIYMHCPKGKVAEAYMKLTQEVLNNEK